MKTLELKCLGSFSFEQDGNPLPGLNSTKGQALFCYLAVTGKRFTRSALAGIFWMDTPENLALVNLRKVLFRMKSLSAHLLIEHETLAFNPNIPLWLDVKEFEDAAADRTDIPRLQYALSLYQGDFLNGFDSDEIPLFDEWVLSQRARLRESALQCLLTLIGYFTDRHSYLTAIQYTRKLLTIESWNEEAHRNLMRLFSLSGQRIAALKQYELCRQILNKELGVEPDLATLHLYQRIIAEDSAGDETGGIPAGVLTASETPVHSLPAAATAFVGRHHERATLKFYLADPQIRLISIAGAGGMGKTQLALSLAHEIAADSKWFQGVFFIPLGSVITRQHLIMSIAGPLDLTLSGARDPEKLLFSFLQDKNFLIVLDNFEPLLAESDFLVKILESAPRCKLLITTRERTKLLQEWVLDLFGLPYSTNTEDVQASNTDSVRLFLQCARQRLADFSLDQNLKAVVRICQFVQGMPLALELAASWIRAMTVSEIADQIAQNYHTLSTELRNLPERHRTIQAVFDSSWHWLSPEEQAAMRRLSVFRAGFSLEAAKQVAGALLPILSSLVDKSFLNLDSNSSEATRYEIHELVRQYANDQLRAAGGTESTHNLFLSYFLALAEQAERYWDTAQEGEWLQRLEVERGNIHAALRWAFEQEQTEILLRLNAALMTFWMYKSPITEAEGWLNASLALTWDGNQTSVIRSRAKVNNVAGYSAVMNSNFQRARNLFEEGLALYSRLADQRGIAWSLRGCAFVAMLQGDYARARPDLEQSLTICEETRDEWGVAWSTFDLGYLAFARGDLAEAEVLLEKALSQCRQHGILWGEFRSLTALGNVHRGQGQSAQAYAHYREALVLEQKYQFSQFFAVILEGVAQLAQDSGEGMLSARLFGAAQKRRDTIEMARWLPLEADYRRSLAQLHEQLTNEAYTKAWLEGCTMSAAEVLTCALDFTRSMVVVSGGEKEESLS